MAVWIKKKASGHYTVYVKHKDKRTSSTVPTLVEARRLKDQIELALSRGQEELDRFGRKFGEVAELWMAEYIEGERRVSTCQKYRSLLDKHIYPHLVKTPLRQIDRPAVRSVLKTMGRTMSPSMVRAAKDVMSGVFGFALDEGIITGANPVLGSTRNLGVEKGKQSEHLEIFTPDEANAVLDAVRDYRPILYPLFLILFRAGLRLGEVLALDWEDLNFRSGYISVSKSFKNGIVSGTKTGKIRQVDMSDQLLLTLKTLRQSERVVAIRSGLSELTGPLFKDNAGNRLSQNSTRNVWKRCLAKAGVEYRKIHSTRHTFASYLLAGSADIYYVSKMLGHANIMMTSNTYGHLVPDRNRTAMNILDSKFGQQNRSTTNEKSTVTQKDYDAFDNLVPKRRLELPRGNPH